MWFLNVVLPVVIGYYVMRFKLNTSKQIIRMLELILGIVFLFTSCSSRQLIYGFNRMKRFSKKNSPKNIFYHCSSVSKRKRKSSNLLHSISLLHYPKELVEIILVDDDSEEVFSVQDLVFSLKVI